MLSSTMFTNELQRVHRLREQGLQLRRDRFLNYEQHLTHNYESMLREKSPFSASG